MQDVLRGGFEQVLGCPEYGCWILVVAPKASDEAIDCFSLSGVDSRECDSGRDEAICRKGGPALGDELPHGLNGGHNLRGGVLKHVTVSKLIDECGDQASCGLQSVGVCGLKVKSLEVV